MSTKKPPPVLEVRFEAKSLRPELVSLLTLSRVLSAVHQLSSGGSEEEADEAESAAEPRELGPFQLLDVKRGSVAYQFAGQSPEAPLGRLRVFGNVLENPETLGDNVSFLGPLDTLSAIARRIDCAVILKEPGKGGAVIAKIEPRSFAMVSETLFVHGESLVAGQVNGVGGATEVRCRLRVPFQPRLLYCKVASPEVARKIGQSLYKHVVVYGQATWLKGSWKLFTFKISDVHEPKPGKLSDTIRAIREAGGKDWDKIGDVEAYLEEVTGR
jgi:hypothetical protein